MVNVNNFLFDLEQKEKEKYFNTINLIASENFTSSAVRKAQGSVFTNKYAEGYPNKRYYGGCEVVDEVELLAQKLACELFNCKYANVQPHCGSSANMAVYMALLNPGDTILSLALEDGGHLTHGKDVSFSGKQYNFIHYGLDGSGRIDYNEVRELSKLYKPKMILTGASAYPYSIDFSIFREIANDFDCLLMVDMAHIAGLVAANLHQNPCDYADVVTSTTHKTLRGPRGGLILTNREDIYKKVNKAVFPGIQGGPLMHVIAAKAVAFEEALRSEFVDYQSDVIINAGTMAEVFKNHGFKVQGTDNHLMLIDTMSSVNKTGKDVENLLGKVGIIVNKNAIHNDKLPPNISSGIRIGTPAITTLGFQESGIRILSKLMVDYLENPVKYENDIKLVVKDLLKKYEENIKKFIE